MNESRPHPRPDASENTAPHTRAELVRYFAWGYLSRRELTARLRQMDKLPNREGDPARAA
jgi:hypothetical protein